MGNPLITLVSEDDWRRGLFDPAFFSRRILGVELHQGQETWLNQSWMPENLLVTGNRWGKSFVSAIKLIHHALYRLRPIEFDHCPQYRAVVGSITQDQANIVFNQVLRLIRRAPVIEALVDEQVRTPFPRINFGNGATIEARSTQNRGEYLLGNDYDLFIFDEVAFETDPEYVVEEVILMRLADREGRLDLISTPKGKNWFYQRARDVIDGHLRGYFQSGDSRQNKFISRGFLDERVRYFTEARVQQNIMGQFVDSGGEILKGEYIDSALERFASERPKSDGTSPFYISGWDLARKQTATVGITVEVHHGLARVVALERFKQFDWIVITEHIRERQRHFPGRLVIDATGLGDVVAEQLADQKPQTVIFTPAVKAELLTNVELKHARQEIAYQRWELPDGPGRVWSLEDELRAARWDDNNRCDALMALALALWPIRRNRLPVVIPRVGKV